MTSSAKRRAIALLLLFMAAFIVLLGKLIRAAQTGVITPPSRRATEWTFSWVDNPIGFSMATCYVLIGAVGCGWLAWRIARVLANPLEPRNAEILRKLSDLAFPRPSMRRVMWAVLAVIVAVFTIVMLLR